MAAKVWCWSRSPSAATSGKPGTRNSTDEMKPAASRTMPKPARAAAAAIMQYTPEATTAQSAVTAYWFRRRLSSSERSN